MQKMVLVFFDTIQWKSKEFFAFGNGFSFRSNRWKRPLETAFKTVFLNSLCKRSLETASRSCDQKSFKKKEKEFPLKKSHFTVKKPFHHRKKPFHHRRLIQLPFFQLPCSYKIKESYVIGWLGFKFKTIIKINYPFPKSHWQANLMNGFWSRKSNTKSVNNECMSSVLNFLCMKYNYLDFNRCLSCSKLKIRWKKRHKNWRETGGQKKKKYTRWTKP